MDSKQADIPVWKVFVAAAERARQLGTEAEVEPLYAKAIALARKSLGHYSKEIGGILLRLADFYVEHKDYAAAEAAYETAVETYERNGEAGSILMAAALSKLAETYEASGNGSRAAAVRLRVKVLLARQLQSMVDD